MLVGGERVLVGRRAEELEADEHHPAEHPPGLSVNIEHPHRHRKKLIAPRGGVVKPGKLFALDDGRNVAFFPVVDGWQQLPQVGRGGELEFRIPVDGWPQVVDLTQRCAALQSAGHEDKSVSLQLGVCRRGGAVGDGGPNGALLALALQLRDCEPFRLRADVAFGPAVLLHRLPSHLLVAVVAVQPPVVELTEQVVRLHVGIVGGLLREVPPGSAIAREGPGLRFVTFALLRSNMHTRM